jgi:hypothetical protein
MEVTQVLHRVCENVLKDPSVSEDILVKRAKVCLLLQNRESPVDDDSRLSSFVVLFSSQRRPTNQMQSDENSRPWSPRLRLARVRQRSLGRGLWKRNTRNWQRSDQRHRVPNRSTLQALLPHLQSRLLTLHMRRGKRKITIQRGDRRRSPLFFSFSNHSYAMIYSY